MASAPIAPGSTIGILGGGQLGKMLAQAAAQLGYSVHIYCPEQDAPAFAVSKSHTIADYNDREALKRFALSVDVVTYEFENIPAAPVAELGKKAIVRPSPDILALSQHRVQEKQAIRKLGIATAPFVPVATFEELHKASGTIGFPAVLKTARMGYDGKGQAMLASERDLPGAWKKLNTDDAILEGFVDFSMEISVIVARDVNGHTECYCPVQNVHKHHILSETIAPAPIPEELAKKAESIARTIANGLQLVGLMAVEMFVTKIGTIVVNELAPRPHNSGHWTIDACKTSQFEQTIRAICGLPLGKPDRLTDARMINLIGPEVEAWEDHMRAGGKVHLYGKKEVREGRKMGHVTFLSRF